MDMEGFVRDKIAETEQKSLEEILTKRILEYKDISYESSYSMAQTVIEEVKNTLKIESYDDKSLKEIINIPKSNVAMGEMGVGSRGAGDFFVHRKIA